MNRTLKSTLNVALALVIALSAVVWFIPAQPVRATGVWYVAPGGYDLNNCVAPSSPCATIQAAVNKAASGNTVQVAVGSYTAAPAAAVVVTITKSLDISGGWDTAFTQQQGLSIIDGQNAKRGLDISGASVTVNMDHFQIQKGYYYSSGGPEGPSGGITNSAALTLSDSFVVKNISTIGGGIINSGILNINNSRVSGNTANGWGGGIYNTGSLTIHESELNYNKTPYSYGGAIFNRELLVISDSSITGNNAGQGGGIYNDKNLDLTNVTINENYSDSGGGGLANGMYDLAIAHLNNVTIYDNQAYMTGGGVTNSSSSQLHMRNSIISENTLKYTVYDSYDCAGTITNEGYNMIRYMNGCSFSDAVLPNLTGVGPQFSPIVAGVYSNYYPLKSTSLAINAGNPAGCLDTQGNPITTDQRGASRSDRCDIGAFEYTVPGPISSLLIVTGDHQSVVVQHPFSVPLQVRAFDALGSPVDQANLDFTAPLSGPSGTFASNGSTTITSVTDAGGLSSPLAFSANDNPGSYHVSVAPAAGPSLIDFSFTNIGQVFLPVIYRANPADIVDEFTFTDRCGSTMITYDGNDEVRVTECVTGVRIRFDGQMYFDYRWSVEFLDPNVTSIYKNSDANNFNMYITDNLGNRYDHVDTGGAAATLVYFYPWGPTSADGWFMFPAKRTGATIFAFHDDDNDPVTVIGDLVLVH